MTNPDYAVVALVVDRSGSMAAIQSDAQGGINTLIMDQRKQAGRTSLTLTQFDTEVETVFDFIDIADATEYELKPRGGTALLDAWGQTMVSLGERLAALPEDERPGSVQFVVVTDGHENSSKEWTRERVFNAVKEQTDKYGWTFTFLAANQDAVATGAQFGVSPNSSLTFSANSAGAQSVFRSASSYVTRARAGGQSVGYTQQERDEAMGTSS